MSQRVLYLLVSLLVLFLTVESDIIQHFEGGGNGGNCILDSNRFNHGDEIPVSGCLKYRCVSGILYPIEEGCFYGSACQPEGFIYESRCKIYTCTRSYQDGRYIYQFIKTSTRCPDINGACHYPGYQFSQMTANGLRHDCTCSIDGAGFVTYLCP